MSTCRAAVAEKVNEYLLGSLAGQYEPLQSCVRSIPYLQQGIGVEVKLEGVVPDSLLRPGVDTNSRLVPPDRDSQDA